MASECTRAQGLKEEITVISSWELKDNIQCLNGEEELGGLNPFLQIRSSPQWHGRSPWGLTWASTWMTEVSYDETRLFDSSRFYRKPFSEERTEWRL